MQKIEQFLKKHQSKINDLIDFVRSLSPMFWILHRRYDKKIDEEFKHLLKSSEFNIGMWNSRISIRYPWDTPWYLVDFKKVFNRTKCDPYMAPSHIFLGNTLYHILWFKPNLIYNRFCMFSKTKYEIDFANIARSQHCYDVLVPYAKKNTVNYNPEILLSPPTINIDYNSHKGRPSRFNIARGERKLKKFVESSPLARVTNLKLLDYTLEDIRRYKKMKELW
jgi:hypothetical protein